jgi:predicted nucleic acid-binding Zn ribbon protein
MAFTALRSILEKVLQDQDYKGDIEAYNVFSQWNMIVGEKVAAHTRPSRISGDVLYVQVDDHLWLAQLRYMKHDILRKIDRHIKPDLFKDVKLFLKAL